jgi:hypothetical protein
VFRRFQAAPLKSAFIILSLLLVAFCPACLQRQLIQPAPRAVTLDNQKSLPFKAALYISEKTKNVGYQSPDYIPWIARPNVETIRPFEIPAGQLLAKTAWQVFSQVFQSVTPVEVLPATGAYSLVLEPSLEHIALEMAYFTTDGRPPHNQLLDIGGSLEATLRLSREGKADWQKTFRVAVPRDRILVNPWTGEQIGGMIAEAIASLVAEMALEMIGDPDKPAVPLDQWLKSVPVP